MSQQDIIVVKIGYLEPDLAQAAHGWVMALSDGAVNQDLTNLDFHHLRHPLVPFDAADFAPTLEPVLQQRDTDTALS